MLCLFCVYVIYASIPRVEEEEFAGVGNTNIWTKTHLKTIKKKIRLIFVVAPHPDFTTHWDFRPAERFLPNEWNGKSEISANIVCIVIARGSVQWFIPEHVAIMGTRAALNEIHANVQPQWRGDGLRQSFVQCGLCGKRRRRRIPHAKSSTQREGNRELPEHWR